jgi:hypothetical protein
MCPNGGMRVAECSALHRTATFAVVGRKTLYAEPAAEPGLFQAAVGYN